jgi:hypothetical protein
MHDRQPSQHSLTAKNNSVDSKFDLNKMGVAA